MRSKADQKKQGSHLPKNGQNKGFPTKNKPIFSGVVLHILLDSSPLGQKKLEQSTINLKKYFPQLANFEAKYKYHSLAESLFYALIASKERRPFGFHATLSHFSTKEGHFFSLCPSFDLQIDEAKALRHVLPKDIQLVFSGEIIQKTAIIRFISYQVEISLPKKRLPYETILTGEVFVQEKNPHDRTFGIKDVLDQLVPFSEYAAPALELKNLTLWQEAIYGFYDLSFQSEAFDLAFQQFLWGQFVSNQFPSWFLNPKEARSFESPSLQGAAIDQTSQQSLLFQHFSSHFLNAKVAKALEHQGQPPLFPVEHAFLGDVQTPKVTQKLGAKKKVQKEQLIHTWLLPFLKNSPEQVAILEKMLLAPDVCFINGGAKTGKKSLIAEAIFQLAQKGERLFILSPQKRLDKILPLLNGTSFIRLLRLDLSQGALRYFYQSLVKAIDNKWLNQWDLYEKEKERIASDEKKAHLYLKNLEIATQSLENAKRLFSQIQNQTNDLKKDYQKETQENKGKKSEAGNLALFFKSLKEEKITFDFPKTYVFLFKRYLDVPFSELSRLGLPFFEKDMNAKNFFLEFSHQYRVLVGLVQKWENLPKEEERISKKGKLEKQIQKLNLQLEKSSEEEGYVLDRKLRELENEWRALTSPIKVAFTEEEKSVLGKALKLILQSETHGASRVSMAVSSLVQGIFSFEKALPKEEFKDSILKEKLLRSQKDLSEAKAILKERQEKMKEKEKDFQAILKKYKATEKNLLLKLSAKKDELDQRFLTEPRFKRDFEDTLRGFKSRLLDERQIKQDEKQYLTTYLKTCNVIATSALLDVSFSHFDTVIIDSATSYTIVDLLPLFMKAKRILFIGDQKLNPAKVGELSYLELLLESEEKDFIEKTLPDFRRHIYFFKHYFENVPAAVKGELKKSYRLHRDILKVVNHFYDEPLESALSYTEEMTACEHGLTILAKDQVAIHPLQHAYWIDAMSLTPSEVISDKECELALKLALEISSQAPTLKIAFLSPFKEQVKAFKEKAKDPLHVFIGTPEEAEGEMFDVVLVSLVKNKGPKLLGAPEKILASFSKAKSLLLILGSITYYQHVAILKENERAFIFKEIIQDLKRQDAFFSSDQFGK